MSEPKVPGRHAEDVKRQDHVPLDDLSALAGRMADLAPEGVRAIVFTYRDNDSGGKAGMCISGYEGTDIEILASLLADLTGSLQAVNIGLGNPVHVALMVR
jgi:hypothetical protein